MKPFRGIKTLLFPCMCTLTNCVSVLLNYIKRKHVWGRHVVEGGGCGFDFLSVILVTFLPDTKYGN